MSVDPLIQAPTSTQSINPYSYIMNNPLAGTDPTGYRAQLGDDFIGDVVRSSGGVFQTTSLSTDANNGSSPNKNNSSSNTNPDTSADIGSQAGIAGDNGGVGGSGAGPTGSHNLGTETVNGQRFSVTATFWDSGDGGGAGSADVLTLGGGALVAGGKKLGVKTLLKGAAALLGGAAAMAVIEGLTPTMMGNGEFSDEEQAELIALRGAYEAGLARSGAQVKAHRGNKVAVIGEDQQNRVMPYAAYVKGISFSIPARYLYESGYMSQFSVQMKQSLSLEFNRGWINGVMDTGFQIHDIGRVTGNSPWYQLELREINRRNYPRIPIKVK